MESERQPIDRSCRNCFVSGILSLALPVSGLLIFSIMGLAGLALPSNHLNNQLTDVLHIYFGVALLLPIPLAILTLIFFIDGMRGLRRDPAKKGLGAAVAGLAISGISTILFIAVAIFFPRI